METPPFENLRRFFERIKNVGFFERLFSWKTVVSLGYDAFGEYQRVQDLLQHHGQEITELAAQNRELVLNSEHRGQQLVQLQQDLVALAAKNEDLVRKISEREGEVGGFRQAEKKDKETIQKLNFDINGLSQKYDLLNVQFTEAQKKIIEFEQMEGDRSRQFEQRIEKVNTLQEQLENDRRRVIQEQQDQIHQQYKEMEQVWQKHEEMVELTIRNICRKVNLKYCDKEEFPFSGKPDNSIVICNQYIVFDAKSPENSEKLDNFPGYIKSEAEKVKKYVDGENVKKEIFLVVPANTVHCLSEFVYRVGDGITVYVVTHDCIEPIILALKKVEDYEFIDQLSPEDRENISQIIGKFVHTAKRRIQIDTFFCDQNLELLDNSLSLPENIQNKLEEIERSEILNPPIEQRKKTIKIKDLERKVKLIKKDAESRDIDVGIITQATFDTIPIHKESE